LIDFKGVFECSDQILIEIIGVLPKKLLKAALMKMKYLEQLVITPT